MITLNEFITKWNNKFCEVTDPTNSNQCFDLAVAWTDALGIPRVFPFLYAYQIYTNFGTEQAKYFTRIENGLFNAPQAGDIVVYKPGFNGGAGDVVVATGKNGLWTFEAFGQNYPLGSPCVIRNAPYNYLQYNGIYGWLHPKVLDKISAEEFRRRVNEKIETQITDTAFRNWTREQLKISG